jgi:hypothetical protein
MTAAVAAVASLLAIPVVTLVLDGPGGGSLSASDWLSAKSMRQAIQWIAPPALASGLLGCVFAGQLLHRAAWRGYVAGATLPLIALAVYMLGLVAPQSVSECLGRGGGPLLCVSGVPVEVAVYLGYALVIVGWLIVPVGIVGTALTRRRWLDSAEGVPRVAIEDDTGP